MPDPTAIRLASEARRADLADDLGIDLDDPLAKAIYRVVSCAENTLLDVEQAASLIRQLDNTIRRYP